MTLRGKTIVLGVSGGIAAYKSAELVRALRREEARVRVVMTHAARQFITPLTLQTLSGEPVATELFDLTQESEIGHIALADSADVLLIAPATANVIGKLACGLADDLLSTVALACTAPLVLAPAMNVHMWESAVVQENLERLARRAAHVVAPDAGDLACGYEGRGRLPDAPVLVEACRAALSTRDLAGETVLITSGPTRENLDPVRFLSNRSSGKMGFALARAALRRGARVVVVSGPTALPDPRGAEVVRIESAAEMEAAARAHGPQASIVIAAAAVADFRPARPTTDKDAKTTKGKDGVMLALETTPDVIAELPRAHGAVVVGFAAETTDLLARARAKLVRKNLDLIVANDVTASGAGFDVDTNRVALVDATGEFELPLLSKDDVADAILDRVQAIRAARPTPRSIQRG